MGQRWVKELNEDEYLAEVSQSSMLACETDLGPVMLISARHATLGNVLFVNNASGKHAMIHN